MCPLLSQASKRKNDDMITNPPTYGSTIVFAVASIRSLADAHMGNSHTKQPPDSTESYNPGYKNTASFAWPTSNTVVMPYRPIHTFVSLQE